MTVEEDRIVRGLAPDNFLLCGALNFTKWIVRRGELSYNTFCVNPLTSPERE